MNAGIFWLFSKKYNVITFDIFDTLVERKTYAPSDIFFVAGSKILGDGMGEVFRRDRIAAEHKARGKKPNAEVTMSDIYRELKDKYKEYSNRLMYSEIETEISMCHPKLKNVELMRAFKKNGKKIYLISDMYLPVGVIVNILGKCSIYERDYDRIYVSNAYEKNKLNGDLFRLCIAENNLSKEQILHFGDSFKADFIGAHKAGINAWIVGRKNRVGRILRKWWGSEC